MKPGTERVWFYMSGPDSRHLINVTAHTRKRDAVAAYKADATSRAKEVHSLDFEPWSVGTNRRIILRQIA